MSGTRPDPAPGADGAGRRCPRWLWGLLALSLALNLVGGGMLLGRHLRQQEMRELGRFNARVLSKMPEEARSEARRVLMADRPAARAVQRKLTDASLAALAAFRADPFDRAALAEALEARDRVLAERGAERAARVIALAEALSPEARAAFAEEVRPLLERRRARLAGQGDGAD